MVVSGALGIFFIILILILAAQRFLLPGIIMLGSFILFVLWLTGLIETSLQLYGVVGNVDDNCQIYIVDNRAGGNNMQTLAWLTQKTICEFFSFFSFSSFFSRLHVQLVILVGMLIRLVGDCWKTAFAFELVNTIFFLWMMIMSWQVNRDVYD